MDLGGEFDGRLMDWTERVGAGVEGWGVITRGTTRPGGMRWNV